MITTESHSTGSITATPASFALRGGRYVMSAVAGSFGTSVELQELAGDGSTFVDVPAVASGTSGLAKLTGNGAVLVDVPPGVYQFLLTGSVTACYCNIASVPV